MRAFNKNIDALFFKLNCKIGIIFQGRPKRNATFPGSQTSSSTPAILQTPPVRGEFSQIFVYHGKESFSMSNVYFKLASLPVLCKWEFDKKMEKLFL